MLEGKRSEQAGNHHQIDLVFASPMLEALNQAAQKKKRSLHEEIRERLTITLGQEQVIEGIIERFSPEIEAALSGEECLNPLIPLLLNPIKIKYVGEFPEAMFYALAAEAKEKELPLHIEISMRLLATLLDYGAFGQPAQKIRVLH